MTPGEKFRQAVKKRVEEKNLAWRRAHGMQQGAPAHLWPKWQAEARKEVKVELARAVIRQIKVNAQAMKNLPGPATTAAMVQVHPTGPQVTPVAQYAAAYPPQKGTSSVAENCWTKLDHIIKYIANKIQNGEKLNSVNRILLYGVPETGKSRAGVTLAEQAGLEYWRQTLNPHAGAFDILGLFSPSENGMKYHLGNALRAWGGGKPDGGGVWIPDEIDKAGGDLEIALHAILDDFSNASLTLPTGQTLRPSRKFVCVATMNGDPKSLTPALRSRFPITIEIDRPNPAAIAKLPKEFQKVAEGLGSHEDETRRVGLRSWFAFTDMLEGGMEKEFAARVVFGEERWVQIADALRLESS